MGETSPSPVRGDAGTPLRLASTPRIPVMALGMSLGLFLAITYVLCVGFDLLFPGMAMYQTWLRLLPGFTWLTWPSFFLGLVETFAYGWFVAFVFGPLFNVFANRWG
ncbi:DUF5676 family membrane protein [Microbaculum sp. FT89]|uniref:DUF5676 family membrane protein n=1 Tax=Microbaculum sp. FT89 TaxID=3447298 RepID=UPI003F539E11